MKKILLTTMVLGFVIVAKPQPPGTPHKPPTAEERLKHTSELLQKEVVLTAAQKAAVEAAFKNFFTAADKVRKDNPPPPPPPPDPKVKAAMDKLVAERDESIKKILSAAQYEKYKEAMKKMHPQGGPGGNNGPPPPRQ
jgi:hypothetical protein